MSTIILACTRIFFIPIEEETTRTHDLSIKGNNMKNKKMAVAGISLLGSIGVISTGFAGWIITAPAQDGTGQGTITADGDVQTKGSVTIGEITYGADIENADICFAANNANAGNEWLKSDQTKKADLNATVNIPLTLGTDVAKLSFTKVKLTPTGTNAAKYADLSPTIVGSLPTLQKSKPGESEKTKGYILAKGPGDATFGEVTAAEDGASVTASFTRGTASRIFSFEIRFAWGSAFGGQNPMDYYNEKPWTKDLEAEAKNNIEQLKNLNNLGFTLTFTVAAVE